MAFTYFLPDENGNKTEHGTTSNAVIIIGANGSGKSKVGAWIEQQNMDQIHRIGAQRNLNFNENIPLKSYSQAEDFVLYGTDDKSSQRGKGPRWAWGKYTTKLIDDFDNVLAALIALKNNDNEKFVNECKAAPTREERPDPPFTSIDKLTQIWNIIFPQRKLRVEDAKFLAVLTRDDSELQYNSNQMSDGERAVLYLAAQVLCVPANKTLIIDEPEIHLHRSIMNRLWSALESYRPDCLFIYITHDTQFAAAHGQSDKVWIKEFDGMHWKLEKIADQELPEELLFDILGSRKNVLFVEGERNSYDTQLYSILYPNYYVIACGSCTQVISRTKAFRNSPSLHHCQVFGIIDRDYRCLLYTSPSPRDRVVAHLKYQLTTIELSKKDDDEAKNSLNTALQNIDYEKTKAEEESKFRGALCEDDYAKVLSVFNEKGLTSSIGHFLGLVDKEYCKSILALLNGKMRNEISDAISTYLPPEIPR